MIQPPYGIIKDGLENGNVIPFLGSGASFVARPAGAHWDPSAPAFLPSGVELAHFLADKAEFPSREPNDRDDLAKVSSYYVVAAGRPKLRDTLHEVFDQKHQLGSVHQYLASITAPLVIVTTNYDTLLEQAFLNAKRPYDLVVYPSDRKEIGNGVLWWQHGDPEPQVRAANELLIDVTMRTVIFKMHGTVNSSDRSWENFVITEEDYIEFLSRMTACTAIPAMFLDHFRQRSFLFLGYSLRDWNLRVVLRNLSKCFAQRREDGDEVPYWAIQLHPSELESWLWAKRGVSIYDLSIDDLVSGLKR